MLKTESRNGFGTATTQRRVGCLGADIRFPMPAAFAFLAVGFANGGENGFPAAVLELDLGDVQKFAQ